MKKIILFVLLTCSIQAFSQIKITHFANKETNMQNWSDVKWSRIHELFFTLDDDSFYLTGGNDSLKINLVNKPVELKHNRFYTNGITSTGEFVRISFNFDRGWLTQVYVLTVGTSFMNYINEYMLITIDNQVHSVEFINTYTQYSDFVFELEKNKLTKNIF